LSFSKQIFQFKKNWTDTESFLLFSLKRQHSKGDANGVINWTIELSTPEVFSRTNRARFEESGCEQLVTAEATRRWASLWWRWQRWLWWVKARRRLEVAGSPPCWIPAVARTPSCFLVIVARDATTPPDESCHARIVDGPMTPGRRDDGIYQ